LQANKGSAEQIKSVKASLSKMKYVKIDSSVKPKRPKKGAEEDT
jgi:hypothetical protein